MSTPEPTPADLLDSLGAALTQGYPFLDVNGHHWDTRLSPLRDLGIAAFAVPPVGPEMDAAAHHIATMSAEKREQLMKEWDQ